MRFRIASLLKLVVVSAVVLWLWRTYGVVGAGASVVVGAMVLMPVVAARLGRLHGEPIAAGALGGAIGWGLLAVAMYVLVPRRVDAPPFGVFVPAGGLIGGLYGLGVVFLQRASRRPRPFDRRRVLRLDLALGAVLLAILLGWPLLEPYRDGLRAGALRTFVPPAPPAPQPRSPAALPKRILPTVKSSRSVSTRANAAPGTKIGAWVPKTRRSAQEDAVSVRIASAPSA
jgi:hypothetical protein